MARYWVSRSLASRYVLQKMKLMVVFRVWGLGFRVEKGSMGVVSMGLVG